MIKIDINNKQNKVKLKENWKDIFTEIASKAARLEGRQSGTISIAFVEDSEIRDINDRFRNKDEATDVLSFPMDDVVWGDIIISIEKTVEQAEEYGHSFKRELAYLYTHGLLHLLGYDHKTDDDKTKMREKEEEILTGIGLDRN